MQETPVQFLGRKDLLEKARLPTPVLLATHSSLLGLPCGSAGKESACSAGGLGLIPGLGRSRGEGNSFLTPVFRPAESHGLHSPWGREELDMTE